jgi:uncharacterized protein DUF1572
VVHLRAPSHTWKGTERFNLEIEVAQRFFDGLVLGFLEGFLELAVENVFLLALRHPRIAKFVFALLGLIGEDARRVADVDIGRGLNGRCVRENHGEVGVHRQLGLAARALHFNRRRRFLGHKDILRLKWFCGAGFSLCHLFHRLILERRRLQNPFMALEFTTSCLKDSVDLLRFYKKLGDRAMAQASDEALFATIDAESNSIAIIVKHLAGNMRSRWTDFLSSDGEKPDRDRDSEFEAPPKTREELLSLWESGWQLAFDALAPLTDADLSRTAYIRTEPHSVMQTIHRQLAHYSYHVGQIVYLAKHFAGPDWSALTIPRRKSAEFNAKVAAGKASQR